MVELAGLRLINTRPAVRASTLDGVLQQLGVQVASLPLLETVPLPIAELQRQWLLELDRYRWVFVVSPTAAELGLQHLSDYWPQWPVAVTWLAVGESTAQVLRTALLQPIVPPQETSEGLLQLDTFQQIQPHDRMLVLRGEGGRNLVRDHLQSQGVQVDYLNLYTRQLPADSPTRWWHISQHAELPQVVLLTSGEILGHWLTVAGEQAQQITPLVISPRLAQLTAQAGLKPAIIASSTRPEDIIHALSTWRNLPKRAID